jgi:hypothetical protein
MGRAFGTHPGHEKYLQNFVGKPEGKDHLGNRGIDGGIILKLILNKSDVRVWIACSCDTAINLRVL